TMMWSSSPVCARPVRTLPRSFLNDSMLLPIFCSVFFLSSGIIASSRRRTDQPCKSYVNQGALVLADDHALQGVLLEDAEHVDRQLLVAAQREGGRVHDFQVAGDRLVEADLGVALRAGIVLGVLGIDAVDLGRLENDLGGHLAAAQRGGGVGGEE